jgi:predicted nucleic acid-binding protein
MRAVFDTNVLVDYLNGVASAKEELARFEDRGISVVTWMEVLVGAAPAEEAAIRMFLGGFTLVPIDTDVADEAVRLRRERKLRLPDAIIWATARTQRALLVTRNTKDFPADDVGVRVPYRVKGDLPRT